MKPRVPKYSSGTAIRQTIYQGISSKGEVVRRHGMVFRDPCSQLLFSESERSHYKYKQLLKKKKFPLNCVFFIADLPLHSTPKQKEEEVFLA